MPETVLSPREAIKRSSVCVGVDDSLGEISADFATPFPPGVPVLVPGERITEEVLRLIKTSGLAKEGIRVLE